MGRLAVLAFVAFTAASCSPESDVTGSIGACTAKLYSSFNPKDLNQCVSACKRCERGTITTCTTACTLRGAR